MIQVTDATKRAYTGDSVEKVLTVTISGGVVITNDDLVSQSLTIKEAIEESGNLTYKGCIASECKFQVADVVQDLRGRAITVSINAGQTEDIVLFTGKITDQTNLTYADKLSTFTCYDAMYDILQTDVTTWYDTLTFPITVKNFRDSLFQTLGVTQETVSLINDNLTLSKNISDKSVNAGDLVKWICQLNARYGQIGRDGIFHYRKLTQITEALYPAVDLYPSPNLYPAAENAHERFNKANYIKITYEPFKTAEVNKVVIYDNTGAVGGQYGSGANEFSIADNVLAQGVNNMTTAATNIYGAISAIAFIPTKLDVPGMPWLECGDSVMVNTMKNIVRTYILSRTLKGIQALLDNYVSESEQYQPNHKQSLRTSVSANTQGVKEAKEDIIRTNQIVATKATIEQLNATNARVGNLEADHVSVTDLQASNARITNIETSYITAATVQANYATITSLNAVNAKFNNLNASNITSGTLSTDYLIKDGHAIGVAGGYFSQGAGGTGPWNFFNFLGYYS